ncbi:putative dehydrogenase [Lewinella aquimaris]|uniref:Putative dehydrogenase n=1 Tax=Neolewinella aquimaris TaxID=1835722 RepID=A0A840E5N8_9BACT|nr:Gfo/Idh/MocA family oxidoreductase [Neolewinella aquimaris]MBB4080501.1 putative dehydrogenase [Neolewinella aquimaris]
MNTLRAAIVGLGKMGLSHAAILTAQPQVDMVAVCDTSVIVTSAFKKYGKAKVYGDFRKMLRNENLDLVVIATPTKLHYDMVRAALEHGVHVFCEKPFSLNSAEGQELVQLAESKGLVNQLGYHNHFIGTFREMKRLLENGVIGELVHFSGEAYGPVVTKEKVGTWRSKSSEGGGCLFDYASHVLNLLQEVVGRPVKINGSLLKQIYSKGVEDAVYTLLTLENGLTGTLLVNWSDETYRKMSTSLTVQGKNGKIVCDATEIKIYLKQANAAEGLEAGWTVKWITDLAIPVGYYLRGEEYSAQIEYFVANVRRQQPGTINTFEQGLYTDKVIEMIQNAA